MRDYEIENEMYRKAVELIEKRYPVGWGGAGVVHTSKGNAELHMEQTGIDGGKNKGQEAAHRSGCGRLFAVCCSSCR